MRVMFLLFTLLFATFSYAETEPQLIEGQLTNGLNYFILPLKQDKGRIEIRLKVKAGAIDQTDQQNGVAHMLEHMVFRASEGYPQGVMTHLHQQGWQRGRHYNAVTNAESTTYMLLPPAKQTLADSLQILSQMVFSAQLTEQDLAKERLIVLEEWRSKQGVAARMNLQRTQSVRVNSRYARGSVLGTAEDIEQISLESLKQFYQQWYVPNNMTLLIVGDVNPQDTIDHIRQYFAQARPKILPERDYYEPQLSNQIRIHQLQDPQSAVSQIAYIWRFDESQSRGDDKQARKARLIDRLTLAMLNQRLRNQQSQLAQGVNSLVVRKSEIGKNTVALGIFAGVEKQSHQQGLQQILQEVERLKRYPFTQAEFEQQKTLSGEQIAFARNNQQSADFSQWVQRLNNTLLMDKSYFSQAKIAEMLAPLLAEIQLADVQQRLNQWLSSPDQIVQYQLPNAVPTFSLNQSQLAQLKEQVAQQEITPPYIPPQLEPMEFAPLKKQGNIVKQQDFTEQNVIHWHLANGDKVVWLKTDLADDKSYFRAISQAGFQAKELINWQSQIASQIIAQSAPLDWQQEQLAQWKKHLKLSLSLNQTEKELTFSGQADNAHFAQLLRLFYAIQQETKIKAEDIDDIKQSIEQQLERQLRQPHQQKLRETTELLKYGKNISIYHLPQHTEELAQLDEQQLNQQWQMMQQTPTTYYIANHLSKDEMQQLVSTYLATIPRGKPLTFAPLLMTKGQQTAQLSLGNQAKQDITMWWATPYPWQGKEAMLVSLIQQIASDKLKLTLRDQQLGIYSLSFTSKLNPQTQQIESELKFTASPENSEKLIKQAEQVLQQLANTITEQDIEQVKTLFQQQESNRLKQINTWLTRLILSEQQYADPRYLTEMQQLTDFISLENVKHILSQFNWNEMKVLIVQP
ncbi:M16 family metallopeptidase [Volucribacter amazonae]|uniref:Zinc protease n=1 Tax=Volucribacter amazonae TaxID=256731 RepID=A0A9X4P9Y6_9PAST|nr:insulinase family protein [Volucribacter amazonae]MDG6895218.1 hypothetical protein [Volucribacter amazonae]